MELDVKRETKFCTIILGYVIDFDFIVRQPPANIFRLFIKNFPNVSDNVNKARILKSCFYYEFFQQLLDAETRIINSASTTSFAERLDRFKGRGQ